MLGFGKKKNKDVNVNNEHSNTHDKDSKTKRKGLFSRLRQGLSKTSQALTSGVSHLISNKKKINEDILEELEDRLLMADVGIEATQTIIDDLSVHLDRKEIDGMDAVMQIIHDKMVDILTACEKPLQIDRQKQPMVILFVGINGAGKTTTIGKLAKKLQQDGQSVMLAAGDTFRAAAVEQLQEWGRRNDIAVIAQGSGADSASVIYDAVESAKAKKVDVLLADTAGRLHTQVGLMDELKKVKRVIQKLDTAAPHEVMLVVDAGIGQNALVQAIAFNEILGLTGITVTKLDGTAKGGILLAMAQKLAIPIRFIGVGESIDDLQVFNASKFCRALLGMDNHNHNHDENKEGALT